MTRSLLHFISPARFVLLLAIAATLLFQLLNASRQLDLNILDGQFRMLRQVMPASQAERKIVVVGIDETSRRNYTEPFSLWHKHLGNFLTAMSKARPAVVGIDVLLPERSYDSLVSGYDLALRRGMIEARHTTRVVYARSVLSDGSLRKIYPRFLYAAGGLNNTGFVLWQLDRDRIVRRFSETFGDPGKHLRTLAGEMSRQLGVPVRSGLINYAYGKPFEYIPFHKVLAWHGSGNQKKLESLFRDRAVFLGVVLSFQDRHYVPVNLAAWEPDNSNRVPGVLIHAQALHSLINRHMISTIPGWLSLLLLITACLAWYRLANSQAAMIGFLFFIAAVWAISAWLLTQDLHWPVGGIMVAGIIGLSFRSAYETMARKIRMAQLQREKERTENEIALAAEIQCSQLPDRNRPLNGITGINIPAEQVSGDFFDYFTRADGKVMFNLGDVSGKGLKTALLMSKTHSLFHCLAKDTDSPGKLMNILNTEIYEKATRGMFVTMTAGIYDPADNTATICNAGHTNTVIRHADGSWSEHEANGPPLGVLEQTQYSETVISLNTARLYLYSDGISEGLERFGTDDTPGTIQALVDTCHTLPIEQQVESVARAVAALSPDQNDDITLLILDPSSII